MINRGRVKLFLPSVLTVAGVLFAWSLWRNIEAVPQAGAPGEGPAAGVLAVDLPSAAEFSMPPLEEFSEIIERPIFSSTRRPDETAAPIIDEGPSNLDVSLRGVIIANEERIAIVQAKGSEKLARLSQGDRLQGWEVTEIAPNSVTFERDGRQETVDLSFDEPPSAPPPRTNSRRDRRRQPANAAGAASQGADRGNDRQSQRNGVQTD